MSMGFDVEDMDDDGPINTTGQPLLKGARLYLASIGSGESPDGERADSICGGVVISPSSVLTSASCVPGDRGWVDFNRHDLTSGLTGDVERRTWSTKEGVLNDNDGFFIRHPNFDIETIDNDFALIIWAKPVDNITTVELNDSSNIPADGDALETFGWGSIPGDVSPNVPHTVTLNFLPNNQCNQDSGVIQEITPKCYALTKMQLGYVWVTTVCGLDPSSIYFPVVMRKLNTSLSL